MRYALRYASIGALAGAFAALGNLPANAADLGGDCCADLEQRVADLEATTVRKGNRKVSVTLSGQVNRAIVFWDDGVDRDANFVDNSYSSTRFRMDGKAAISPEMTAGFIVEMELDSGATSAALSASNRTNGKGGATDSLLDIRNAAWWLEHKGMGRVTVGRYVHSGSALGSIDLGNLAGHASLGGLGQSAPGAFAVRGMIGTTPLAIDTTWATVGAKTITGTRGELVRYDTPTMGGFKASASWGDDDTWGVDAQLEYTGGGFTGGVIVGYQAFGSETSPPETADNKRNERRLAAGAGLRHDVTGIFAQGGYARITYGGSDSELPEATLWGVQGGVSRSFGSLGRTTFYGEYGQTENLGVGTEVNWMVNGAPVGPVAVVADSKATFWGLGVVQQIDAAAMDLYVGYRNWSLDGSACSPGAATSLADCRAAAFDDVKLHDFQTIIAGARIKF